MKLDLVKSESRGSLGYDGAHLGPVGQNEGMGYR